jgi:hypothetical protein
MRRRKTLIVSAAALGTLLAGCGAAAAQPPATLPSGVASQSSASSAAAVATLPADAPKFNVPGDLRLVIDADSTGDPTKDAILLDAQYQFYAFVEALSNGDVKDTSFKAWTVGDAYVGLSQSVRTWKSRGQRLTGMDHVFNRTVTVNSDGQHAVYSACEDSSQTQALTIATGQRGTNTAGPGNYTLWQGTFTKQAANTWALNLVFTKPGASQCAVG